MMTIAEAVIAEMEREGARYTWFGDLDVWGNAYTNATGKRAHPMDAWQAVRTALSRSRLFRLEGRIRAASWSGREVLHPRYVIVAQRRTVGRFEVSFDSRPKEQYSIEHVLVREIVDSADRKRKHLSTIFGPLPMRVVGAKLFEVERAIDEHLPSEAECASLFT